MIQLNISHGCCSAQQQLREQSRETPTLSIPLGSQQLLQTSVSGVFLPADLCFGVLLAFFLLIRTIQQSKTNDVSTAPSLAAVLACFLLGVIATPIVMVSLPLFVGYRLLVHVYLKRSVGARFAGLLQGPDVVWAMELPEARSIITVLVVLEAPAADLLCHRGEKTHGKRLLQTLRNLTTESLLVPTSGFPKLMQLRRRSKLGYHYWTVCDDLDATKFVRCLDISDNHMPDLSESELQLIAGEYCNKPLPFSDTATWELLVGQQPFRYPKGSSSQPLRFPVIFRVHHSVGDGVALLRLLLEGLADRADYKSLSAGAKQKLWTQDHSCNEEKKNDECFAGKADENQPTLVVGEQAEVPLVFFVPLKTSIEPTISLIKHQATKTVFLVHQTTADGTSETSSMSISNPKTGMASKVKAAFKLKKVGLTKGREKEQQASGAVKAATIRGLGMASLVSKMPLVHHLRQSARAAGFVKLKTCVVPPRPRSVSPSVHYVAAAGSNKSSIARRCTSFSEADTSRNISVYNLKISLSPESLPSKTPIEEVHSLSSVMDKCSIYTDLVNPGDSRPNTPFSERLKLKLPCLKDFLIYLIAATLVSVICVKRSVGTLLQISYPTVRNIFLFMFFTPYVMFNQIWGTTDDSILYGKKLSGGKVTSWIVEGENEPRLVSKIRRIRDHYGGALKFSQVLLACLSRSLHRFYQRRSTIVPSSVNIVLPARVDIEDLSKGLKTTAFCRVGSVQARVTRLHGARRVLRRPFQLHNVSFNSSTDSEPDETLRRADCVHAALSKPTAHRRALLENKFTVAMMNLPVGSVPLIDDNRLLSMVGMECLRLRRAPDYLANYWLLRWVAHLLPAPLLRPCLGGAPCSLVLSNLPGPEDVVHLARMPVRDIVFWVPNRGLSGVGIGMLSYCGRFSMGIVADKALIATQEQAHEIIKGVFTELDHLVDGCVDGRSIRGNQVNED